MVSREQINKTITDIIEKRKVLIVKCKPSYRPSVLKSFHNIAKEYGFEIRTYKDGSMFNKDALVTLYDPLHDTGIEFTKGFINHNNIDFTNNNRKAINIEDIFTSYDNLPNKCKDRVGIIKHIESDDYADGRCGMFGDEDLEFGSIIIPSSYFDRMSSSYFDGNPYELVLAHESMHARDYHEFTNEEKEAYLKYKVDGYLNMTDDEIALRDRVDNFIDLYPDTDRFQITYGIMDDYEIYRKSIDENAKYLNNDVDDEGYNSLNKSSDYGTTFPYENYAEAGAMVITGYHNPTNPNSRVRFNGEWMQYQEWARLHPYQVQYIVKDLYNEEVSIKDILEDTIPSERYGDFAPHLDNMVNK